jgi:8-oxo-dGTP pyrophosphatase MutT (NUDIX family)
MCIFTRMMQEFIKELNACFERPLPGIRAHQDYAPEGREINPSALPIHTYRNSAVAVICTFFENHPSLILTKRMPYDGVHGGQISFPGGKIENDDPTSEHAARRETREEIGWSLETHHLIGKLTDVYIPVSKFRVEPYFYLIDELQDFQLNPREVSEIIPLPVDFLVSQNSSRNVTIPLAGKSVLKDVPAFVYNEHIIWGATALMLGEIKTMLMQQR